jgi:hypothetical protein
MKYTTLHYDNGAIVRKDFATYQEAETFLREAHPDIYGIHSHTDRIMFASPHEDTWNFIVANFPEWKSITTEDTLPSAYYALERDFSPTRFKGLLGGKYWCERKHHYIALCEFVENFAKERDMKLACVQFTTDVLECKQRGRDILTVFHENFTMKGVPFMRRYEQLLRAFAEEHQNYMAHRLSEELAADLIDFYIRLREQPISLLSGTSAEINGEMRR